MFKLPEINHGIDPGPLWKNATKVRMKTTEAIETAFLSDSEPNKPPRIIVEQNIPVNPKICKIFRPKRSMKNKLKKIS